MGLEIYDNTQALYTGAPFRAVINGHLGGSHEELIYIRNDDVTKWYSNSSISVLQTTYDALGELGSSGISFKFMYGERRPTEAEWDIVVSGQPLALPNIGSTVIADTNTYHPVWVRVFLPGGTPADILDSYKIRLYFLPRVVGL